MRAKQQILSRHLGMLQALSEPAPRGSRIVVLSSTECAVQIAKNFKNGVVILLNHGTFHSIEPDVELPSNLEVLSCGLYGAQFLPQSVFAVVALDRCKMFWENSDNLQLVAQWLQPGGVLCLEATTQWDWHWFIERLQGSASDLTALAQSVGLRQEAPPESSLRVWRKIPAVANS